MNTPYVKKYENGILQNPITKQTPYVQQPSRKGEKKFRKFSNTKGFSMLLTRIGLFSFQKYHKRYQQTPNGNVIQHLVAVK